ncbi:hypothetical protein SAMN05720759_10437 [Fibrobacter sp. UWB12]|nr:hypothetical protein SAMN05720759_10437 [Fibrobacter sp. UWB12]
MKLRILFLLFLFSVVAFSQPSKKELYDRARDVLRKSLESRDLDRAGEALDYLKTNVENGAPLSEVEEYLVNLELGRFEDALIFYGEIHRDIFDKNYTRPVVSRIETEDLLNRYLLRTNQMEKQNIDSLCVRIDASEERQEYKLLHKTLVYLDFVTAHSSTTQNGNDIVVLNYNEELSSIEEFLALMKKYIEEYPYSDHAKYLKDLFVEPYQKYLDEQKQFKQDPWGQKYYTGGFGFYLYTGFGFMTGEASDYLKYETDSPIIIGLDFRVKRFDLSLFWSFGYITGYNFNKCDVDLKRMSSQGANVFGREGSWAVGASLGFVAYDSRYLRVEPFAGISSLMYDHLASTTLVPEFMLGNNVDFRFYAAQPSSVGNMSYSFLLRFRYMLHVGSVKEHCCNNGKDFSAVRHSFAFGIGAELW